MTDLSSFSIAKPHFLFLTLAVFPAFLYVWHKFKKIQSAFDDEKSLRHLRISFFLSVFFRSIAWIFMVLALSEISFGSKKIPVTKSGRNISLVFDISYSMLAKDAQKNLSRLDAAKIYASNLVEKMSASSFSVVLAKGSGFLALPETEDREAVFNLIENLSPHLMTSAGTSLSKGIDAALTGIPENSSKSQYIVLFTDCDETDGLIEKSLEKAIGLYVPVLILGFGGEKEVEITAGDGKNRVKTALRSEKIKQIVEKLNDYPSKKNYSKNQVRYIDALAKGSAKQIIDFIENSASEEKAVVYQSKNVCRHGFFIFFALIFIVLSFCRFRSKN